MGTEGIDEAAAAFDLEISDRGPPSKSNGADRSERPSVSMFPNLGVAEVDEESPAKGGGDDEDPEEALYKDSPEGEDGGSEDESAEESADDPDDDGKEEDEKGAEDGEDAELLGTKFNVLVDGEEQEVTVKEALAGYIRTKTFHQRLSEIGENTQILQRSASEVVKNYEYVQQIIDTMEGQMAQLVPPEPNWDEMFKNDPAKARNLQKYYEQVNEFKNSLKKQREETSAKLSEHHTEQLRTYADQEALRFNRINQKNWGTVPKKKMKDIESMRKTALAEGFAEEEIKQVFDSRMLQVLLKASKYDRMMAAKPKPVQRQSVGKTVTPGSGNKRTGRKGLTVAMKNLARTGTVHDAGPVFDEILRRNR
jgi:hypothetical protein